MFWIFKASDELWSPSNMLKVNNLLDTARGLGCAFVRHFFIAGLQPGFVDARLLGV